MAIALQFIDAPSGNSNKWKIFPSGSDTIDADNVQHVLSTAAQRRLTTRKDADVTFEDGDFWIAHQVTVVNFHGRIRGKGVNKTALIAGHQNGTPMDLLTRDQCIANSQLPVPRMLRFHGAPNDDGTDLIVEDIAFTTVAQTTARSGYVHFGHNWDTGSLGYYVEVYGIVGDVRAANLIDLTANGGGLLTAEVRFARFSPSDIGKKLYLRGLYNANENDAGWPIVGYISPTKVQITNPDGFTQAGLNATAIIMPFPLPMGRRDFTCRRCTFTGTRGGSGLGNVNPDWNVPICNIDGAVWSKDEGVSLVVGTSTPPDGPFFPGYHDFDGTDYYWITFALRPANGILKFEDCSMYDVGGSHHMGGNFENPTNYLNFWTPPQNCVTPISSYKGCEIINAGYTPGDGGAGGILGIDFIGGTAEIIDCIQINTEPPPVGTSLGGLGLVSSGVGYCVGAGRPGELGGFILDVQSPVAQKMIITGNKVSLPAGSQQFMNVQHLFGSATVLLSEAKVSRNIGLGANSTNGFIVGGCSSVEVKNNFMEGPAFVLNEFSNGTINASNNTASTTNLPVIRLRNRPANSRVR